MLLSTKTLYVIAVAPIGATLTGLGDNLSGKNRKVLAFAGMAGLALLGLRLFGIFK